MQNLSNISVIRDLLTRYGFTFSKALGQNFLINPSVCPRMAELGGAAPGTGMIEIGAGIGVLTAELAKRADKVVCVEIDSRLLPILDETLADPAPGPEEVLLQKERLETLSRLLSAMSAGDRALFYRKYYYLQSTQQMAAELGTTARAVEGRLYRIRKKLQKQMGGELA